MSFVREQVVKRLTRSKGWSKVRKRHVKENPFCAACGRFSGLEVHHIIDFSTEPELELEPDNLITLCRKTCHLLLGHLRDWKSINPDIETDSQVLFEKIVNRR